MEYRNAIAIFASVSVLVVLEMARIVRGMDLATGENDKTDWTDVEYGDSFLSSASEFLSVSPISEVMIRMDSVGLVFLLLESSIVMTLIGFGLLFDSIRPDALIIISVYIVLWYFLPLIGIQEYDLLTNQRVWPKSYGFHYTGMFIISILLLVLTSRLPAFENFQYNDYLAALGIAIGILILLAVKVFLFINMLIEEVQTAKDER